MAGLSKNSQPTGANALLNMLSQRFAEMREKLNLDDDKIYGMAAYARRIAEAGERTKARDLLAILAVCAPDKAYLQTCLGAVNAQLGNMDAAALHFGKALDLDPDDIAANTHLGEILLFKGDLELAGKHLQHAIALDPEGQDAFGLRARGLEETLEMLVEEVRTKGAGALEEAMERLRKFNDESADLESASPPAAPSAVPAGMPV